MRCNKEFRIHQIPYSLFSWGKVECPWAPTQTPDIISNWAPELSGALLLNRNTSYRCLETWYRFIIRSVNSSIKASGLNGRRRSRSTSKHSSELPPDGSTKAI